MKNNIIIVVTIIVVVAVIVTFFNFSKQQDKKTKLSVFAMIEPGTKESETFKLTLNAFKKKYPDIELDIEEVPHKPFHSKLQAMAVANQLPDVILLWPGKRTGYVTDAGLIKDLRPWLKGKENLFMKGLLDPQGANGEIWELPQFITSTHTMYTNNKLLEKLGLTFPKNLHELIMQSDKIREEGYIPIAMGNSEGWPMQSCLFSTLTERAGGLEWFDKVIKGDGASFTDPEFVNALNVLKTLTDKKIFIPGMNQMDRTQAVEMFVQEKAVYYIEGAWRVADFQKTLTDEQKKYISLNVFPDIPNQKGLSGSQSAVPGTGYGMNANLSGEKADAAWNWIWHFAGPVGSEIRIKTAAMVPAYKVEAPDSADILLDKLIVFLNEHPITYVLDNKLDGEGMMNVLNPGLQELTMGVITPLELARKYETWVEQNDSNRD